MTTRLIVAYGLIALMIAFTVTVGLWGWYRSQLRVDMRQRKQALKGYAERRAARQALEESGTP